MQTENLIKLLTETLRFYGEEKNYENNLIKIDGGFSARHVLSIVKNINDNIQSYETMFNDFEIKVNENMSAEDLMKIIKEFKNIE